MICEVLGLPFQHESFAETETVNVERVEEIMSRSGSTYSHVAVVHCETSSGVFNDVQSIGRIIKEHSPGMLDQFYHYINSFGYVYIYKITTHLSRASSSLFAFTPAGIRLHVVYFLVIPSQQLCFVHPRVFLHNVDISLCHLQSSE